MSWVDLNDTSQRLLEKEFHLSFKFLVKMKRNFLIVLFVSLFFANPAAAWDPLGAIGAVKEVRKLLAELSYEREQINENVKSRINQISNEASALIEEMDQLIANGIESIDQAVEQRIDQFFIESTSLILIISDEVKSIVRLAACESSSLLKEFETAVERQIWFWQNVPEEAGKKYLIYQSARFKELDTFNQETDIDEVILLYGDLSRSAAIALCHHKVNPGSVQLLETKIDNFSDSASVWAWLAFD